MARMSGRLHGVLQQGAVAGCCGTKVSTDRNLALFLPVFLHEHLQHTANDSDLRTENTSHKNP